MSIKLMNHQVNVLKQTETMNKVAYYLDMGLGKTFIGAEKAVKLGINILVVCQKSKVEDWYNHFKDNYGNVCDVHNLTEWVKKDWNNLSKINNIKDAYITVFIINYDLIWRRTELSNLNNFTLILDESSLVQNASSKRSKFILKKLNPTNVVLLSGTPVNGKYENLYSQIKLLGWDISEELFKRQYIVYQMNELGYPIVTGYQNVDRLKRKLREHGCIFMKTEEVLDLPEQRFVNVNVDTTKEYKYFMKNDIVTINNVEFVGDTSLTKLLYARQLASAFNENKLTALSDLVESTSSRLIIFYNFNVELENILKVLPTDRPLSFINGKCKDLNNYEKCDNSITLCQYQSASMGHNLQKADKIIYFSPTLSSDLYEQSKKRIHRIGQSNKCIYYLLKSGIEYSIYNTLDERKDYTDELFKEEFK